MATVATPQIRQLVSDWEKLYGSAKCSGVVPDVRHLAQGGYHCSREDQVNSSNYSVVRPDDKAGPGNAAAAIDMTMNQADMRLCSTRLMVAFTNVADPRRKYLNAFNGTLNNTSAKRWDIYARTTKRATADHLWHVHLEIRRKYVDSPTAMRAILSLLKGETVSQYLASIGKASVMSVSLSTSSTRAPAYPGRVLSRNDSQKAPDPAVLQWQARMIARGWRSLGVADGRFGPKLESVVRRWQGVIGVGVDGKIGPETWPTPWTRPLGK